MSKILIFLPLIIVLGGCSLSPGMHMHTKNNGSSQYVYIESLNTNLEIKNINTLKEDDGAIDNQYRIGNGDQISITIWGLPEIFPISNINPDQNLRRVDSKGNIFFPYAGVVQAAGKTQEELRSHLSKLLSKNFNSPQLDVSIARFNSQKIYMLGEVTRPKRLNLSDVPISLSDALGEVQGINTNTADGSKVFIVRQGAQAPSIYVADLSSPSGFLDAGGFYLKDNDIIYVNAKNTTRWNRVISQFFPFSSFLNSVDNLTND